MSFDELIDTLTKDAAKECSYGRRERNPELRGECFGRAAGMLYAVTLIKRCKNELRTSDNSEVPALQG